MKDPILVAERSALQQLVHETPDGDRVQGATISMGIHILLQIAITELEDEDKLGLGVNNVVQADDVDVLELLHEGNLADGGGWCTFFSI